MSEALQEALGLVARKVEEANAAFKLNLNLLHTQCRDGHDVWVIRQTGKESGGLVVAHIDEDFREANLVTLAGMLTMAFFKDGMVRKYLLKAEQWSYIDPATRKGMAVIQLDTPDSPPAKYWSHGLQCMWI